MTESPADKYCRLYFEAVNSTERDMCGCPSHERERHIAHEAMLQEWLKRQEAK